MSAKRRDTNGRILRDGESQRKDGRYMYRYTDNFGERITIYSWKLVDTDPLPQGKKECESLRSQIKEIQKNQDRKVSVSKGKRTLNYYHELRLETSRNMRETTKMCSDALYNTHIHDTIGEKGVASISPFDIKKLINKLIDAGLKRNTIQAIVSKLQADLKTAMLDGAISELPTAGARAYIKESCDDDERDGVALTQQHEKDALELVRSSEVYSYYYPFILFLLRTGCRVSEAAAVCWSDIDFQNNTINICKTFSKIDGGKSVCVAQPKTRSGIRTVPLLSDLKQVLLDERKKQMQGINRNRLEVDGYTNFVFQTKRHLPMKPNTINGVVKYIKKGLGIDSLVAHDFRRTFCTRLCESGMNIKLISKIMGHANIGITMRIYTKINDDFAEQELKKVVNLYTKIYTN